MRLAADIAFMEEVKRYNEQELRELVYNTYNLLGEKYNKIVGFGFGGCKEFVAALILSEFDHTTSQYIDHGVEQVFMGNWGPVDFSNFMDKVIFENSCISYPAWSRAYRFIVKSHAWLEDHPCSAANTVRSSATKGIFSRKLINS
ncbi:hypothetical protein NSQ43_15610 [Sporosarcina sp. FSL W8-0480]|uniref:hypothetical protein n=1 Tax=Sporosarcina sp. FSL W8-0480 TaxID=2954701 RepID=UPI0030DC2E84